MVSWSWWYRSLDLIGTTVRYHNNTILQYTCIVYIYYYIIGFSLIPRRLWWQGTKKITKSREVMQSQEINHQISPSQIIRPWNSSCLRLYLYNIMYYYRYHVLLQQRTSSRGWYFFSAHTGIGALSQIIADFSRLTPLSTTVVVH